MSQLNTHSLPADRAEVVDLLRRAAKNLKKNKPDQKLVVFQDEIASSYGYQNWSMLHKNARNMTQSQFAHFAALVLRNLESRGFHLAQAKVAEASPIKCKLFSKNIGYLANEFNDGDAQAIVLSDSHTVKSVMESNDAYYYNAGKVEMHRELLRQGMFEVPLVAPTGDYLYWIEGFHQVNAAIEEGMTVVPIGTSLALAQQLKSLVGVTIPDAAADRYDFSACGASVM
ncbi:hypothetical protein [Paraburkholderia sediminicola]|uniref:hypothetical protein n=1 Tax=Paraburkholderia sediminicola TaxID=458836 RepID=UPI0038BD86A4